MTVDKLKKILNKWPGHYKITDSFGRSITGVHLSSCSCGKERTHGVVWLKFKKGIVTHIKALLEN